MSSPLLVGHLASGGGTTMENVARRMQSGELGDIRPSVVIADRVCGAIDKARQLGIPTELIQKKDFAGQIVQWAQKISSVLQRHQVNLVFQNGWQPLTPQYIIERWPDILNQHPGPLSGNGQPDFGGKGMCGTAVTAARILYLLESGEEDPGKLTTESVVHKVNSRLDEGRLVSIMPHSLAEVIQRLRSDDITNIQSALAKKTEFDSFVALAQEGLLPIEHKNVARVLADRASGLQTSVERDEWSEQYDGVVLSRAKQTAIKMYPTK